jgi:hypothetical protein
MSSVITYAKMLVKDFSKESNLPVDMLSLWVYSLFEDDLNRHCSKYKGIWCVHVGASGLDNGFRVSIIPKEFVPLKDALSRIQKLNEKYHSFEIKANEAVGTYAIGYPNLDEGYLFKIEPEGLTVFSSISEPKDLAILDETLREVLGVDIDCPSSNPDR